MNYLIAVEFHGFQVPKSMSITYRGKKLHIYPGNYISLINGVKKQIKYINSPEFREHTLLKTKRFFQFEVGQERSTIVILNYDLDLHQTHIDLYNEIYNFFKTFLKINWVISEYFLNISRILIFKKQNCFHYLLRGINRKLRLSSGRTKFHNFEIENYEEQIELITQTAEKNNLNEAVVGLFYELTYARNALNTETKIIYLWNYLEHLANLYARIQNINLLIDQEKFENLKDKISKRLVKLVEENENFNAVIDTDVLEQKINEIINNFNREAKLKKPLSKEVLKALKKNIREEVNNAIKETDILISGYDNHQITQNIMKQINDFPSVRILIELLANNAGYNLNEEETNLIFYMNKARNHYFHESLDNDTLFEVLKNEINSRENQEIENLDFNTYTELIEKFEKFLEKITFHILEFPVNLKEKRSSQSAEFIGFNKNIHKDEDTASYFTSIFNNILEQYTQQNKYYSLLMFISKTIDNFSKNIKRFEISGLCYSIKSDKDFIPVQIMFEDEFSAVFKIQGRIEISQITFAYCLFLKDKEFKFDSLLEFQAFTDIDLIFDRFSFEADLLDFKINADESAKKDTTKYAPLKDAIIPLPLDFLDDEYFSKYFETPAEYIEILKKKTSEIEMNFPYIIITPIKINELKRFKNIIGMFFKGSSRDGDVLTLYYYRYLGQHPNNPNIALWSTREELKFNRSEEYCFTFPFIAGTYGAVIFTNSPNLFATHIILFAEKRKFMEEFNLINGILLSYLKLLYEIHSNKKIDLDLFEKLKNYKKERIEVKIQGPDDVKIFMEYFQRTINLITQISLYPRIKEIFDMSIEIEKLKKSIVPFIEDDYKGISWLSFGLTTILYFFLTTDDSFIKKMEDSNIKNLLNVCQLINGKPLSNEFFDKLLAFLNDYIESYKD